MSARRSNWPLNAASRVEALGLSGGPPVNGASGVTSGGANAKGSYTTLGTTTFAYSGFFVWFDNISASERCRIDIAINTGGSDTIIVEDFFVDAANQGLLLAEDFPVAIPAGATVKIRFQASGASRTAGAYIVGYATAFSGRIGGSKIRSLTNFTNTTPTNAVTQTGNTQTAWTVITASTVARVSRLWIVPCGNGDTTRTSDSGVVEIGIGGSGSEVVFASFCISQSTSRLLNPKFKMPCDIPAGSRLTFRAAMANAASADSMSCAAMGLAA